MSQIGRWADLSPSNRDFAQAPVIDVRAANHFGPLVGFRSNEFPEFRQDQTNRTTSLITQPLDFDASSALMGLVKQAIDPGQRNAGLVNI
jgi:hypothetical protein